jgi:hypothetical protein
VDPQNGCVCWVSFLKAAKDVEVTNDMFDGDTQVSEFTVCLSYSLAEGLLGWFRLGRLAVSLKVLKPLIASISQDFTEFMELNTTTFEELKVMFSSFTNQNIENFLAFLVNDHLRLQRMTSFLT